MSCNPSFSEELGPWPPAIKTTGAFDNWALTIAEIVLVKPGPKVTNTTAALPVNRAYASAINVAACSWRTVMISMGVFSTAY